MKLISNIRHWHTNQTLMYAVGVCIFSATVLVGAWITVATMLHSQWQETLESEMRQNTNTALALKEHTLRILDTVDQAMLRLQEHVSEGAFNSEEIVRIANETGMTTQILTQLSFVDAAGNFRCSNLDPDGSRSRHVNLLDREHIRQHLLGSNTLATSPSKLQDGLFIGHPVQGKVSGVWTIQLSRKITASDGSTQGVVVASLNQRHFADVYQGVRLGEQGGVVLAGLDGTIRVRVIGGVSTETQQPLPGSLMYKLHQEVTGAALTTSSDGVPRIVGYSRVGDYPLFVLSGTSENEAFAAWRATRNTVILLMLLLSLVVIGFVAMAVIRIKRMASSHADLARSAAEAQRANEAKSEYIAAMSHELRTPLTSIRGFAELMELRSSDARVREQSGLIRQGAEHLNALLTEVLDLAKIEAGAMPTHPEPVELLTLVRELTDLFRVSAMAKGLTLQLLLPPYTQSILLVTDPLKLKQILNNLLSNAIKFTSQGSVSLEIECTPNTNRVMLHVTDTGPGIPEELQQQIFERFRQAHSRINHQYGGTGLGLSLSRSLAGLLGGTLVVSPSPHGGARFTLSLPCPQSSASSASGVVALQGLPINASDDQ